MRVVRSCESTGNIHCSPNSAYTDLAAGIAYFLLFSLFWLFQTHDIFVAYIICIHVLSIPLCCNDGPLHASYTMNHLIIALDNVTCYAFDNISKLWRPIGEGLIVYGCFVIEINSLKCIVEERGGRETDIRTDRQADRQADSDRVRECVQLGCQVSLMTKPTTETSMIEQRNQTSNAPNVGKTSSEESRERERAQRGRNKNGKQHIEMVSAMTRKTR